MMFKKFRGAVALAVAAAVVGAAHVTATAAPATDLPFAEQARTLGLSNAQAAELQKEVTTYLDKLGGTQDAINKIDLDHGGFVLVTLPGETYARDLENPSVAAPGDCPASYLCAFRYTNFTGDIISTNVCRSHRDIPWTTMGSYVNKLSNGARGTFIVNDGVAGVSRSNTAPSPAQQTPWNWLNTWSIWACQVG
jgi:Peptidase inhibitor family I36